MSETGKDELTNKLVEKSKGLSDEERLSLAFLVFGLVCFRDIVREINNSFNLDSCNSIKNTDEHN